jgi:hypothetical protein
MRERDLEAAYVNFLKAISIVVEVIPQHRAMKVIESRKMVEAEEYWVVRTVRLMHCRHSLLICFQRVSIAIDTVQNIKSQLLGSQLPSSPPNVQPAVSSGLDHPQGILSSHHSGVTPLSVDGITYKIPRKLVPPPSPGPVNGNPSRPVSAASSANSSSHISTLVSQTSSETRPTTTDTNSTRQASPFPIANVIEPSQLLSYMSIPEKSRPSILFLDMRPKARYEQGCINARNVVWIDPILLDSE